MINILRDILFEHPARYSKKFGEDNWEYYGIYIDNKDVIKGTE
ncbi:MAG: hypothetical protein ACFFC3_03060 [Candidatus Odinarchaeota archaeon]